MIVTILNTETQDEAEFVTENNIDIYDKEVLNIILDYNKKISTSRNACLSEDMIKPDINQKAFSSFYWIHHRFTSGLVSSMASGDEQQITFQMPFSLISIYSESSILLTC